MAKYPVYQRIVDLLEAEGIDTLFGIPDPGFVHMAIDARSRGWKLVAPHHEQAGAFMADGWSRLTGKPGVIFGTAGPGVANLAAAAIVAAKENAPTIFLGSNRNRQAERKVKRGRIQYISQPRYFEAAMKYTTIVEFPDQIDEIMREAIRQCMTGKAGPVYVEIPMDVITEEFDWPPVLPPESYRLVHQSASEQAIAKAVELIKQAEQPIVLCGQGVFTARAQDAASTLAQLIGCPVVRTTGTDAYLPGVEDRMFPYGFSPAGRAAVATSDLCIAVGTEIGEPLHFGIGRHWAANNAKRKWIYIERDPTAIGVNRRIDVPLVGNLQDILPQLASALSGAALKGSPRLDELIGIEAEYRAGLVSEAPSGRALIHPARLVIEATKAVPNDAVFVRDGGSLSIFGWTYPQNKPRDMLWNQNLGHLGTGLPYALGAQLAVGPDRPVVLITSDSTFLFHTTELETAARKNLPVVVIVGVDHQWGLEVGAARMIFGEDVEAPEGQWSREVRFDRIAEGLGCRGEYVDREEDIGPAVERALKSGKPTVIHVPIDPQANANEVPNMEEFQSWYENVGIWID